MKRALSLVMGVGMVLCTASAASASPIANWAALNALLGGFAVTENFEAFAVAPGTGAFVGGVLDATSTPGGQGPGLIVPNLQVSTSFGDLFWQGAGFFSLPTRTMGADPARDITLDFLGPMAAFGMDLLNYGGFPATYQVTVYGSDDATVLSVSTVSFRRRSPRRSSASSSPAASGESASMPSRGSGRSPTTSHLAPFPSRDR